MNDTNVSVEEVAPEVSYAKEIIVSEEKTVPKKKVKKHKQAVDLVEKAKGMVKEAEEQNQACKLLLAGDLKEYDEAKESLRKGGLDTCISLLEKLGYTNINETAQEKEDVVVFEPKEELAPIALKNVSSGKFTGFLLALAGGAVTAIGLIYLATEKLGTTIDISKVPTVETMEHTVSWLSTAVGLESNAYVGAGLLALASVSVMALIYAMRVGLKGRKNLHFATKQLSEAERYTEKKADCKKEMDKVDAHMKETVSLLKLYQVMFNEQKGKLERILHIEGSKEKSSDYHEKSFLEIRDTKELIHTIKDFISTPMSEEGRLSEKSVHLLNRSKSQIDKILERLY